MRSTECHSSCVVLACSAILVFTSTPGKSYATLTACMITYMSVCQHSAG